MEICVKCKVAYVPLTNGVAVNETASFGSYKLWSADLKECPKCKHQIIAGFAKEPYSEHHQEKHKEYFERAKAMGILFDWNEVE